MRVLCLTKRWRHHTASGGYDRLASEVGAEEVRRRDFHRIVSRLFLKARLALLLNRPDLPDYRQEDLYSEKELLAKAREIRPDVVHVLYGDDQMDWLLKTDEPLACPLVVSYHLPTVRAIAGLDAIGQSALSRIDAVIVLASYELVDYQRWFRADQLFYVPHGIDTARFCPAPRPPASPGVQLVTVGTHMRDWAAIERIVHTFEARGLPVQFHVVDSYRHCQFLKKYKNVRLLSSLSEDELIALYRRADALLLPVVSSTANNAVLESIACGTPVISTAIEGIPDYVDAASGWLFPKGEVDGIVRLVESALADPVVFNAMREGARRKSLEFDWKVVASQTQEVYKVAIARGAMRGLAAGSAVD
jgi:glycosyltransferase involved in cell wall biosynthesis